MYRKRIFFCLLILLLFVAYIDGCLEWKCHNWIPPSGFLLASGKKCDDLFSLCMIIYFWLSVLINRGETYVERLICKDCFFGDNLMWTNSEWKYKTIAFKALNSRQSSVNQGVEIKNQDSLKLVFLSMVCV